MFRRFLTGRMAPSLNTLSSKLEVLVTTRCDSLERMFDVTVENSSGTAYHERQIEAKFRNDSIKFLRIAKQKELLGALVRWHLGSDFFT